MNSGNTPRCYAAIVPPCPIDLRTRCIRNSTISGASGKGCGHCSKAVPSREAPTLMIAMASARTSPRASLASAVGPQIRKGPTAVRLSMLSAPGTQYARCPAFLKRQMTKRISVPPVARHYPDAGLQRVVQVQDEGAGHPWQVAGPGKNRGAAPDGARRALRINLIVDGSRACLCSHVL